MFFMTTVMWKRGDFGLIFDVGLLACGLMPFDVVLEDGVEFGKHLKFAIQYSTILPTMSQNTLTVLIKEFG